MDNIGGLRYIDIVGNNNIEGRTGNRDSYYSIDWGRYWDSQ